MTTIKIVEVDESDPTALFCHYPHESIQPAHIALDLEDGELTADYNPTIGNGIPFTVFHGRTHWIDIPILTAAAANNLLREIEPIAQRILDGSRIKWDGDNNKGYLNEDATAALDALTERCQPDNPAFDPSDIIQEYDAGDWYENDDTEEVIARLGLTAGTTDAQIDAMAAEETKDAAATSGMAYIILTGADEWLADRREELRDGEREELEEVGEQVETLTARRDVLIARQVGWGDTLRAVGGRAQLTHVQAGNIAKKINVDGLGDGR
jgi:hypothetical protein